MRIAILHPCIKKPTAEKELAIRLCLAASKIGWEAIEVGVSTEIEAFAPDAVLSLHLRSPKLTSYPTYGCMWNPIQYCQSSQEIVRNILSYDSYLFGSPEIFTWLTRKLKFSTKKCDFVSFYTSCYETTYQPPYTTQPRLVYLGSNWDGGERHKDLFTHLDRQDYAEFYGKPDGWKYLRNSYKGIIPFDGVSVLHTLNRAGVGLCLHTEAHTASKVASMRIFEIVASGAIAICGEHAFVQEHFGDTVFYLSQNLTEPEQVEQITEYIQWIQNHPKLATEMSVEAHQIFLEKFTLEKLLLGFEQYHQQRIATEVTAKTHSESTRSLKSVQLLLKVNQPDLAALQTTLDSVANQTHQNVSLVVLQSQASEALKTVLQPYQDRLRPDLITLPCSYSSTLLWCGLREITADYFGVLNVGDRLEPHHICELVDTLENCPDQGIACAGSIFVKQNCQSSIEAGTDHVSDIEPASILFLDQFDLFETIFAENFIASNSYLARRSVLSEALMFEDPHLETAEDLYFLMSLYSRASIAFSHRITFSVHQSSAQVENWQSTRIRIIQKFLHQEIPIQMTIGYFSHLRNIEAAFGNFQHEIERRQQESQLLSQQLASCESELRQAQTKIRSMETSKFWKLRAICLQVKQILGIKTN